jgi:hypothetical protein
MVMQIMPEALLSYSHTSVSAVIMVLVGSRASLVNAFSLVEASKSTSYPEQVSQ